MFRIGHGIITVNEVDILDSNFFSDPPNFTLRGDTRGGPPESYFWRRNGEVISDGGPYSISIRVNGVFSNNIPTAMSRIVTQESRYRSTLVVAGYLLGIYEYSVTNRATRTTVVDSFIIEGIICTHYVHYVLGTFGLHAFLYT